MHGRSPAGNLGCLQGCPLSEAESSSVPGGASPVSSASAGENPSPSTAGSGSPTPRKTSPAWLKILASVAVAIDTVLIVPALVGTTPGLSPLSWLEHHPIVLIVLLAVFTAPLVAVAAIATQREVEQERREFGESLPGLLVNQVRGLWLPEREARGLQPGERIQVPWRPFRDPEFIGIVSVQPVVRVPPAAQRTLESVLQLFESLPNRQLLVLGAPGAGKTGLAIQLAISLCEKADATSEIPVIVSLSSWNPRRQHLPEWFAQRAPLDYGISAGASKKLSPKLVEMLNSGQIVAVLDGLDEMPRDLHARATDEINRIAVAGIKFVLTCRTEQYQAAVRKGLKFLDKAYAIELERVPGTVANSYLLQRVPSLDQRWTAVTGTLTSNRQATVSLMLSTPFMLSVMKRVYDDPDSEPGEVLHERDAASLENLMLDKYLDAEYAQPGPDFEPTGPRRPYSPTVARKWLAFLANQTGEDHSGGRGTDLSWWLLARNNLSLTRRIVAGLVIGALLGTVGGALFAVSNPAPFSFALTISLSIAVGVSVGIKGAPEKCSELVLRPRQSLAARWPQFGGGLLLGALAYAGLAAAKQPRLGAPFLPLGLLVGFFRFLSRPSDTVHAASPQSLLRNDRTNFLLYIVAGTVVGLLGGTIVTAIHAEFPTWLAGAIAGALVGTLMGEHLHGRLGAAIGCVTLGSLDALIGTLAPAKLGGSPGMVYGAVVFGISCALAGALSNTAYGWFTIYRLYAVAARRLPFGLIDFMEDARERRVLRQSGGSYEFAHERLQKLLLSRVHSPLEHSPD